MPVDYECREAALLPAGRHSSTHGIFWSPCQDFSTAENARLNVVPQRLGTVIA